MGHDADRWQIIQMRAKFFADKKAFRKAKLLLLEDFENEVLNDDSIAGFADRQFHQTSWIAKEAAQWLQSVCKTPVPVSRGEMTAGLRRKWKLETVIPQARAEEGLPILDEEGAVVTPEDFAKFRDVWEMHKVLDNHGKLDKARHTDRKLDKRIDHRHHLIDAITIALTSRSLFAQMARQYKLESERVGLSEKPRLRIGEALPLKNVRELALKAVRECPLSIKPDRKPDGAMFKDNPYGRAFSGKEDRFMLTKRSKLADFVFDLKEKKNKDGTPKKTVEQQAKENILTIVSIQTRQTVLAEFEKRLKDGKTVEETMFEPIYQSMYGKKIEIKKVVCFTTYSAEDFSPIEHPNHLNPTVPFFKYLRDDEYAYMEIINHENGSQTVSLVSRRAGMAQKNKKATLGVIQYYKGDIVEDLTTGLKYRVKKFAAGDGKKPRPTMITVRWTESADDVGRVKQADGRMDFFNERLSQIKLVNQNV